MTDFDVVAPQSTQRAVPETASSFLSGKPGAAKAKKILPCYASYSLCMNETGNCSDHGKCSNKYGKDDEEGNKACFACRCLSTTVTRGDEDKANGMKTIHWGGNACQKEDISVQFWLLAGFTILIVGAVTFAISLLFNVGQEELPGVIGAGVSRGAAK